MPLSPDDAIKLTEENCRQADDLCRMIDAWLAARATARAARSLLAHRGGRMPRRKALRYKAAYRQADGNAAVNAKLREYRREVIDQIVDGVGAFGTFGEAMAACIVTDDTHAAPQVICDRIPAA